MNTWTDAEAVVLAVVVTPGGADVAEAGTDVGTDVAELAADVAAEVLVTGAAADDAPMVTPALAQYWMPKAWAATRMGQDIVI